MQRFILPMGLLAALSTSAAFADRRNDIMTIEGYVTHGVNVFNDHKIADFSKTTPGVPWLEPTPLLHEIGVYEPGAANAGVITESTDRSRPVATSSDFFQFFNPSGSVDRTLFNRTLDTIGTNYFGFTKLDDRIIPTPFGSATGTEVHLAPNTNARPTVGDWDKANGQIQVRCNADGSGKVRVTMRNAFPNALYTLWDIGSKNPQTPNETAYGVPLGGLPNVMITDDAGCGFKEVEVPTCPRLTCKAGDASCSSYISAFYHWDSQVYGGSPAAAYAGVPEGTVAANQMFWPVAGKTLVAPHTRFYPKGQGCGSHSRGFYSRHWK